MNVVETMPTELQLVSPPTMPQARSYRSGFLSDLQEYDVVRGNLIKINIPRLQRSYLEKDTYLQFRLNVDVVTAAANACLALDRAGAYSLIDRIEIYDYLGGTLLEQTNQVGPLMTVLNDVNVAADDYNDIMQAIEGYEGSGVGVNTNVTTDYLEMRTSPSGRFLGRETGGGTANRCWVLDLAIRLPSFLGMFSEKLCPLHNGFTVNVYLNSKEQAMITRTYIPTQNAATNSTVSNLSITQAWVSNVVLDCGILELGDTAESLLMSTQPWVIHSKQYRNFRDNVDKNTSYKRLDLNLNVVSLRNIYAIQRPWDWQNSLGFPSIGERVRNYLQRFNFQYGSSYLPSVNGILCRGEKPDYTKSSGYVVTDNKAGDFGPAYYSMFKSSRTKTPSINLNEFIRDVVNADDPPFGNTNTTYSGKFIACLNTQLTPKSIISGLDTNGLMVGLNFNFYIDPTDTTATQINTVLDVWAEHDTFIQVIPGVATTVTF